MWPRDFKFFRNFGESIRTIFIFNTIKSYPEGLTYYDLKKFGNIPHSKIYRMMKILEEKGDLLRKNDISKETGRPKHLYFLSKQGEARLIELRKNMVDLFDLLKSRFPEDIPDFDHANFLEHATFKVWSSPVEYLMSKDISDKKKLESLSEMESEVNRILEKIRKEKILLQSKIKNNEAGLE
jgi:predicted ArsR family transcriptional regulator